MKFAALSACFVFFLVTACSATTPEGNRPPTAHVPTLSHEISFGQSVYLSGYGRDEDGSIVAYLWRSELDGELSRSATFETSSLSVGNHVVYFSVQDDNGQWSEPVRTSVIVNPLVVIVPQIHLFSASPLDIRVGQNVTLSWNVVDASVVAIDQGIGVVSGSGSLSVAPGRTTTYVLTAVAGGLMSSATVTVSVEPVHVVVLHPAPDLSGYVRFSGYAPYGEVYVGDDEADRGVRGFLTYYIHEIPRNSRITRVSVDMSGYAAPYDDPFPGLGCLSAYEHSYNTLQGQYRVATASGALQEWCSLNELDSPAESTGLRDLLQARLGDERLQFRLQFANGETDADQTRDLLTWRGPTLPSLTIEYYTAG